VLSSGNVRFVIQENDQYYISPVVSNFTDEADNALLVAQATTGSWFPYDPAVDIAAVDTSDPSSKATLSFTDIQGVGVWMDATVNTNTGFRLYPRIGLDSFKVGALVNTPSAADVKQAWFDLYSSGMGTNTADTADADGDGIKNIIEYAFGGDPTNSASTGNQPSHGVVDSAGSDVLEVVYFERSDAASRGLATSLKESDNLVFTDFADATSVIVVGSGPSTNAGFNAVTNHVSIDGDVKFISIDVNYSGE
jgi:hypothetical protein